MITEILLAGVSFFQPQAQQDSLGVETVNGKIFVIHKVSEKETLYGISRRYGATVDAVLEYNPTASSGLEIGQILKVPYTPKSVATRPTGGGIVHVVAAKETMFSISKAYNVTMDEIRQWNNLQDNNLAIGQEILIKRRNTASASTAVPVNTATNQNTKGVHIVGPKETLYSLARQYNLTVDQIREWNKMESNELRIGQSLFIANPSQSVSPVISQETVKPNVPVVKNDEPVSEQSVQTSSTQTQPQANNIPVKTEPVTVSQPPIRITESVKNSDEISEAGLAELIEGTEGNRKYLALHRTAPVGSILKVKNEMNNREVFVRVTGKLPDTALTEKLVIKVSRSAYDRLGAIDPRFRVQVTYYK
jgi:LysM repeat protein